MHHVPWWSTTKTLGSLYPPKSLRLFELGWLSIHPGPSSQKTRPKSDSLYFLLPKAKSLTHLLRWRPPTRPPSVTFSKFWEFQDQTSTKPGRFGWFLWGRSTLSWWFGPMNCYLRGGNESDDNDECENTLKILKNPLGMMFVTASPFIVMPLVVIFQLIPSILTHLIVNWNFSWPPSEIAI